MSEGGGSEVRPSRSAATSSDERPRLESSRSIQSKSAALGAPQSFWLVPPVRHRPDLDQGGLGDQGAMRDLEIAEFGAGAAEQVVGADARVGLLQAGEQGGLLLEDRAQRRRIGLGRQHAVALT